MFSLSCSFQKVHDEPSIALQDFTLVAELVREVVVDLKHSLKLDDEHIEALYNIIFPFWKFEASNIFAE